MSNKLKAYIRFDSSGRIVPSSLILQRSMPKVGKWKEINANECCNPIPAPTEITIGTQIWTIKNLDVSTYANGDPIINDSWGSLTTGQCCNYNNDPVNDAIYGKLYNWAAVNDPRGLAPVGYHVPTLAEWDILTDFLGSITVAGGKLKETGFTHWLDPNTGATNESGFTALGSGTRSWNGIFQVINQYTAFWTSTEQAFNTMQAHDKGIRSTSQGVNDYTTDKRSGFSVRLIKD